MAVISLLPGAMSIVRLPPSAPLPSWLGSGPFTSVTRTDRELSIVCAEAMVPAGEQAVSGWRLLALSGPLDFALTGILSSIATPLAAAKVALFAISTYDTDHVLVREADVERAVDALRDAGHQVTRTE